MPFNSRLLFLLAGAFTFFVLITLRPRNRGTDAPAPFLTMDEDSLPAFEHIPLVTDAAPARDDGTLDVSRCAALHNFLVRYGWAGMGHSLSDVPRQNFFEKHHDDAEEVRDQLHQDLAAFLEIAIMAEETFFVFVEGINDPSDMFRGDDLMPDESESDPHRFVVLYGTNSGLGEHDVGLIYDQKRHKASMALGMEDIDSVITPIEEHQNMWYPLETVLTKWIELIRAGKVTTKIDPYTSGIIPDGSDSTPEGAVSDEDDADEDDADEESEADLFDPNAHTEWVPWIWHSYGRTQVATTVAAFHRLAQAIESRMPPGPSQTGSAPLLSAEALDAARVPEECFIRSFLTRARRPRFTRIAPGLTIAANDAEAFSRMQRFTSLQEAVDEELDPRDGTVVPPVLIFPAAQEINGRARTTVPSNKLTTVSSGSWARYLPHLDQASIPAGLYSEGVERRDLDSAEEGFQFVLASFARSVGGEQYARKSDGSLIEGDSVVDLFQHGHKPFGGEWWRPQRLERLFDWWTTLVETRVWTVGPDGVEGTVEIFDNANTAAGWRHYWISPDW